MKTRLTLSHVVGGALLVLVASAPAPGQTIPPIAERVDLSGPRFGFTVLSDGIVKKLGTRNAIDVAPVVTQFGWQFEKQFYSRRVSGPTVVTEAVLLFGGLEQGVALPSLSWLTGIRTRNGTEFGLGPNVTPVGTALAFAAGRTFRAGVLNVPVNLAVVPSKAGVRVSALAGFSLRR
jgi:hypothetical protein